MNNQPNFTRIFFDALRNVDKIRYVSRSGANFSHDIIFLGSLIHDATFDIQGILRTGNKVSINLTRIRWELAESGDTQENVLPEVASLLEFHDVTALRWIGEDVNISSKLNYIIPKELRDGETTKSQVDKLFIGESTFLDRTDLQELVLFGYPSNWKLRVWIKEESGYITLQDL